MIDIKFRAYQKNFKRIFDVVSIGFCKNGIEKIEIFNGENTLPRYSTYRLDSKEFPLSDIELMQYTGLQDMNGKEIYDGYIVKAFGEVIGFVRFGLYGDKMTNHGFFIEWDKTQPYFRKDIGFWAINGEIKVIGNIYENPELLENKEV